MFDFLARNHISDKIIAVGVSGGADSLALALQADAELKVYGIKIVALTVNHGLREKSAAEAEYVAQIMNQYGIEHHILCWQGEKPRHGIETAARAARYALLKEWCSARQIRCLMMAHHLRDQAETFLLRLQRGSGLEGLCGMREVSNWNGLQILRPFLYKNPEEMQEYLCARGIEWTHDESNDNTEFLRNKIRAFLPCLEQETGISVMQLAATAKRLQSAEAYIKQQVDAIMHREVAYFGPDVARIKYQDYLRWHSEIKFRILGRLLKKEYIPRADSLLQLTAALDKLPFGGATLGGKEIFLQYNYIWVVPELQAKQKDSRKRWKEFAATHTKYQQEKFPHKVRLAILQNEEGKNDL